MSDPVSTAVQNWRDDPAWPDVDVVMPVRNEADHLADAVAAVEAQVYPGRVRVFLSIGPSTDDTEAVAAKLAELHSNLTIVANPSGRTPAALNLGIAAGSAPVVVRVDGHSQLSDGYIQRSVETLRRTGAANVGGRQVPVAATPFEASVATATTSWLGTGGPSYRVGRTETAVDTVYLGVFDRRAIEDAGLFDVRLIRNQDYELNIRLRAAGGVVVFDPELAVGYQPRSSWAALARQYYEYGLWKSAVLRRHPGSLRLRQIVAPAAICAISLATLVGLRRRSAWIVPVLYWAGLLSLDRGFARLRTACVLATIHGSWTGGLLRGFIASPSHERKAVEPPKTPDS